MKTNYLSILLVALATILTICYTYSKGCQDGEQRYKQSHRMYLALKSAYHFGWMDGHEGRREDWDGPDLVDTTTLIADSVCMADVTEQDIYSVIDEVNKESKYFKFHVSGLPHRPRWVTLDGKECK